MSSHYDWSYEPDNGPSEWHIHYPKAAGPKQSPIDIDTYAAEYDEHLAHSPLEFDYQRERHMKLINTGHAAQGVIEEKSTVSGGPLKGSWKLAQFHIHIGARDAKGSEHTINGLQHSAEIHLVHWNYEKYETIEAAMQSEDEGLCVLAVLVKVGDEDDDDLDPLTNKLKHIHHTGDTVTLRRPFDLKDLLPNNTEKYWTYEGSLTTPPNYEGVTWIVFEDMISVSEDQLNSVRSLCRGDKYDHIVNNYRPPNPLGNRVVKSSFTYEKPE